MPTSSFTLRLDTDLKTRLEAQAATEDRSTAAIAQRAIKDFLDRSDALRLAIEAGDADIDAGRVVDGDAVHDWLASLGTSNELPLPTAHRNPAKF